MPRTKVAPVVLPTSSACRPNLSLDLGNANSNMRGDDGLTADFRSIQGLLGENSRTTAPPYENTIKFQEQWYVFGESAYTYATQIEDYTSVDRYTSLWYKRLFAYALHRAYCLRLEEGPFYPHIIMSVPAEEYANDLRVASIKANLVGSYVIGNWEGKFDLQVVVEPENLTIIPEGAGTYYYMLNTGNDTDQSIYAAGEWAVGDFGYLTFDVVFFRDGHYMPELSVSSSLYGIQMLATQVAKFVHGKGGKNMPAEWYDGKLECDLISVNGRSFDIRAVRETTMKKLAEGAGRFIVRSARLQSLSGIMLAGGGSMFYRDRLNMAGMPASIVVPMPGRSNVEGAYLLQCGV